MLIKNSENRYGLIAVSLHWLVALMVVAMAALGFYMVTLDLYDPWYKKAPDLHRSFGVLLFSIMLLRLVWRWLNPVPKAADGVKSWEFTVGHLVHLLLYLLLFAIMFSGYLISTADGRGVLVFNWFEVPALISSIDNLEDIAGAVHQALVFVLAFFVFLHTAAALKHHFVNRDRTLLRMFLK